MIVENAFTVAAPMDDVFDALRDVRTVLPCLDARITEVVDDHTARGELTIPMGDATMVFSGTLRVGEADRQAGAIIFEAVGLGAGSASAQGRMSVRLRESAGSTTVSVHADLEMADTLPVVGSDDTERAARNLFTRLGSEVAERIARDDAVTVRGTVRLQAPPVPTPADQPQGLLGFAQRHPLLVAGGLVAAVGLVVVARRSGAGTTNQPY